MCGSGAHLETEESGSQSAAHNPWKTSICRGTDMGKVRTPALTELRWHEKSGNREAILDYQKSGGVAAPFENWEIASREHWVPAPRPDPLFTVYRWITGIWRLRQARCEHWSCPHAPWQHQFRLWNKSHKRNFESLASWRQDTRCGADGTVRSSRRFKKLGRTFPKFNMSFDLQIVGQS